MGNENVTLDEIFRQCSKIFEQYLTNPIFRNNMNLLMQIPIQEKDVQNAMQILQMVENKYYYELVDSKTPWKPQILDVSSAIKEVLDTGKSFCRLSDGECQLMMGRSIGFQEYNAELARKLLQILSDEPTNCLVGINRYYWYFKDDAERNKSDHQRRWMALSVPQYRDFFAANCNRNKIYIDSCIGAYMSQKSDQACMERFNELQSLFVGKNVVIVAGETVFKNLKYDFFSVTAQRELIHAPRVNAYSVFDKIMDKLLTYPKDTIFALILGPTATVLAYELSAHGYTAYDVGHVAKDYDAFMRKADRSSAATAAFYAPD